MDLFPQPPTDLSRRRFVQGVALGGAVAGPILRWKEGTTVNLRVTNRLRVPSSIHWHGIILPFQEDGVPGISFDGIAPGETFVYRFQIRQAGTYWYHSHSGFQEQTGLYGPLVIEPAGPDRYPTDRDYVMMLSEDGNAMLLALKAAYDAINQRPDTPGYFLFVGTGSHRTLVSELTTRRNQAFAGAVSRPFPVLGRDYVKQLLARMRADGTKPLPSLDATVKAFGVLGYRPEELKKAMESLATSFPTGGNVDQIFGVVVQTLRTATADLDIRALENLGALAEAVFQRLATAPSGAKGVFSTEAAADYGRFVGRPVHVEEIQPVVNALLGANLVMRLGHGAYAVTDPFVQEVWKERTQDGRRRVSPTAGGMSRKPPALSPTPRRKKRSKN